MKVGQIVRAAGSPAVSYGVETVGMADTHLNRVRSAIARAAAPAGSGKSFDAILWAYDGTSGTLDPAFDAHVLPLSYWATAWWQRWRPAGALSEALKKAQRKLSGPNRTMWARVTGPTTAVVATARRLGWAFITPSKIKTDLVRILDLQLDPPIVVEWEAKAAVRR